MKFGKPGECVKKDIYVEASLEEGERMKGDTDRFVKLHCPPLRTKQGGVTVRYPPAGSYKKDRDRSKKKTEKRVAVVKCGEVRGREEGGLCSSEKGTYTTENTCDQGWYRGGSLPAALRKTRVDSRGGEKGNLMSYETDVSYETDGMMMDRDFLLPIC